MKVTMISGIHGLLPYSMAVYRDALQNTLREEHPEIELHDHSIDAVKLPVASGLINRYLRYLPSARHIQSDVVHILDQNNAAMALLVADHIPVLQTVHDFSPAYFDRLAKPLLKLQGKGICRANTIVTPSEATAEDLVQALGISREKIHVIPNGVDDRIFNTASPQTPSYAHQQPLILHVGSEVARKNLGSVFRVFKRVLEQHPKARLIRVGQASAESAKTIQDLGISDAVDYVNDCTDEALASLYRSADVLLFPSTHEGFGLPVLEAMSCGCPVVTSNTSSLPEVGGDSVLYAKPDAVEQLAQAIEQILSRPEMTQQLIQRGLKHAASFRWSHNASTLSQLYHQAQTSDCRSNHVAT